MTNQILSEHKEIKSSVVNLLSEARETYSNYLEDKTDYINAFEELKKKAEEGRFSIIVVGEFSAGKSTFLNALMHEKYLDSFSDETTANINFLRSVKDSPTGSPMIRVNYKDGRQEESSDVSFENIQKYVSTKGDNVASEIDNVEIFLDSEFLNEGVDLIDSPGLNGTKELHADITKNQMKASHAAIFMFRATQPGSKTDFQTLHTLKKSCKSIIIVLNRIDEAAKEGEQTVEEIVDNLKHNFKDQFPDEAIPEVWPISAYKALVARSQKDLQFNERTSHTPEEKVKYLETSRIEEFENRLIRYITKGEKTKNELLSPVENVINSAEETISELEVEKQTLNGAYSTDVINDQISAIQDEIKDVKSTIASKKNDVENAIYDAVRNAKNSIKSDTRDIKNVILGNLENETEITSLENNAKNYVSRIVSKYESTFNDALDELEGEFKKTIRMNIEGSISIINQKLSSVCDANDNIMIQNIEIDMSRIGGDINLDKYDKVIDELKKEKADAQRNQWEAEDTTAENEQIKEEIEITRQEIRDVEGERKFRVTTMQDPGVTYNNEIVQRKVYGEKRGWWNPCRWFGDEYKSHMETFTEKVPDYTAHNQYLEDKKQVEEQYDRRIKDLEQRKRELENKYVSGNASALSARRFQFEKEDLDRQIQEKREERDKEFEAKLKVQVKSAKDYLKGIFDDLEANARKSALNALDEKQNNLLDLAIEILETEIKDELKEKEEKLNNFKKKLELAENDKEERLNKIDSALSALYELKTKADEVYSAINKIETDVIKED